ncbi:MAG TPA: D-alanine--D-alanine ligase [Spirochaetia bacterium]|nr:D-alanine--D-alanine ligase [Spirochaetia bacterium]
MRPKVGVLLGGRSAERAVSLNSGEAVYQALLSRGYEAVKIDPAEDVAAKIKEAGIALAFLALHGRWGEDGTIQGLLEILDIPYTGSGVLASALAIDKVATKKMLIYEDIPTPPFAVVDRKELDREGYDAVQERLLGLLSLPVVIKPATEGSTIGMSFVHKEEELVPALQKAFGCGPLVLAEKFIAGMELTASILGNDEPVALPLIEIVSATGVYDYDAKYTVGMSQHIIPPRLPEEQQETMKSLALAAYRAVGCRGLARVDGIVDASGGVHILEVNTLPGMTVTSLFPDAARAAGLEFPDLVEKLVELALER